MHHIPEQMAYQQVMDFVPLEDRLHLEGNLRTLDLFPLWFEVIGRADFQTLFSSKDPLRQSLLHLKKDLLSKEDFTTLLIFHNVLQSKEPFEKVALFEEKEVVSQHALTLLRNSLLKDHTEEEEESFCQKMKKHSEIQNYFFCFEEEKIVLSFAMMKEYLQLLPYPVELYPILGNCSPRDALSLRMRNYQDLRFPFPGLSFDPVNEFQSPDQKDWVSYFFELSIAHSYIPKYHRLVWYSFAEKLRFLGNQEDPEDQEAIFFLYKILIQKKIDCYPKEKAFSAPLFWEVTDGFWKDWLDEHVVTEELKEQVVDAFEMAFQETSPEFFPQIIHSLEDRKENSEDLISQRLLRRSKQSP